MQATLTEILADVAGFQEINDRSEAGNNLSAADRDALLRMAPSIVRKHIEFFTAFFATWLTELDPTLEMQATDGSYVYAFQDTNDAADAAEMVIGQVLNEALASTVSVGMLMAFLWRYNRALSVTEDEAGALIRTIARMAYGYRSSTFAAFVAEGRSLLRQDALNRWFRRGAVAGLGLLAVWAAFKL
jgi:hypothetical protein